MRYWTSFIAALLLGATSLKTVFGGVPDPLYMRSQLIIGTESWDKAQAYVRRKWEANKTPETNAAYAFFLTRSKSDTDQFQGHELTVAAQAEGSELALMLMGEQLIIGKFEPSDPELGYAYLQDAARAGYTTALNSEGKFRYAGMGAPRDRALALQLFITAAQRGDTGGLDWCYDTEIKHFPDEPSIHRLGYLANINGSPKAHDMLKEQSKRQPSALRYYYMAILSRASRGAPYPTSEIKAATKFLEAEAAENAEVLVLLGDIHNAGKGNASHEKGYAYYERAVALGSIDARTKRAHCLAEGRGVKKDVEQAVAEFRAMASKNNAHALALLGYYHYWGELEGGGLAKDEKAAFEYSRRAAELGDGVGALNTGYCHYFGIGKDIDYLQASHYFLIAAKQGYKGASDHLYRCLGAIKD